MYNNFGENKIWKYARSPTSRRARHNVTVIASHYYIFHNIYRRVLRERKSRPINNKLVVGLVEFGRSPCNMRVLCSYVVVFNTVGVYNLSYTNTSHDYHNNITVEKKNKYYNVLCTHHVEIIIPFWMDFSARMPVFRV